MPAEVFDPGPSDGWVENALAEIRRVDGRLARRTREDKPAVEAARQRAQDRHGRVVELDVPGTPVFRARDGQDAVREVDILVPPKGNCSPCRRPVFIANAMIFQLIS